MDWRISVNTVDASVLPKSGQGEIGAMVIRAPKGPNTPQYFQKGSEPQILNMFGIPSSDYPDIAEAIEFNKYSPLWLSAPYLLTDTRGGVLVTTTTVEPLVSGLVGDAEPSFGANDIMVVAALNPYTDDLAVKISFVADADPLKGGIWTLVLYKKDPKTLQYGILKTYNFSLVPNTFNGFKKNIHVDKVFENNPYIKIFVKAGDCVDMAAYQLNYVAPAVATMVELDGGSRTALDLTDNADLAVFLAGWDAFKKETTYPVDLFMDGTGTAADKFDDLSTKADGSGQEYAYYITKLPAIIEGTTVDDFDALVDAKPAQFDNPSVAFYVNDGLLRDDYAQTSFWSSLIGHIGRKLTAMEDVYDALPPCNYDEGTHGGLLGGKIISLRNEYSPEQQRQLDEAGINPIVMDNLRGAFIGGHRTGQNPAILSDWSWIAHVRLFLRLIKTIRTNVLKPQITKLNDDNHRLAARMAIEDILKPVLTLGALAEAIVVCDESNNPAEVRELRDFVVDVAVKVNTFAETITLNFTNVGQNTDVKLVYG